ncbi:MAG: hypothetical protein ACLP01_15635 [Solirubrobacteraceae bacterium]
MSGPPVQRIAVADLRRLFNTEILPKIREKRYVEVVRSEGIPSPRSGQPIGTKSQMVEYWEPAGTHLVKIALVHRYLRADGTLGGSGLPDPKFVVHDGVRYGIIP